MILFFQNIYLFWIVWSIFFILFFIYILYLVRKRKHYYAHSTEFEPPKNIHPLLAGYLIDGKFNIRDYIAGFIYLVQQGFVDVDKQKPKKIILKGVDLEYAQDLIKDIAIQEAYMEKGLSFRKASFMYGILFLFVFVGFLFYVQQITNSSHSLHFLYDSYLFLGSLPVSTYLAYKIVYLAKPKLTEKGGKAKDSLLGFKKYLAVVEADRLEYFNSPKSKPDVFMEYLPYAIALGVDKNWNYKYAGLLHNPPSWYMPEYIQLPMLPEGMHSITDVIRMIQEHVKNEKK